MASGLLSEVAVFREERRPLAGVVLERVRAPAWVSDEETADLEVVKSGMVGLESG